jgi:hypothetical protein
MTNNSHLTLARHAGEIARNEADDIVAVIDWEFAYIAPTQFALDPP